MAAVGAAELAESLCPPANGNIPVGLYVPLLEFNPFCAPMAEGELLPPRGDTQFSGGRQGALFGRERGQLHLWRGGQPDLALRPELPFKPASNSSREFDQFLPIGLRAILYAVRLRPWPARRQIIGRLSSSSFRLRPSCPDGCPAIEIDTKAHITELIKPTDFSHNDLADRVLLGPNNVFLSVHPGEEDRRRTGLGLWLAYAAKPRLPVVLCGRRFDRLVHNIIPLRRRCFRSRLRRRWELGRRIGGRGLNRLARHGGAHCAKIVGVSQTI